MKTLKRGSDQNRDTGFIRSITNSFAPFHSLRSRQFITAPRASRSVQEDAQQEKDKANFEAKKKGATPTSAKGKKKGKGSAPETHFVPGAVGVQADVEAALGKRIEQKRSFSNKINYNALSRVFDTETGQVKNPAKNKKRNRFDESSDDDDSSSEESSSESESEDEKPKVKKQPLHKPTKKKKKKVESDSDDDDGELNEHYSYV